MTPTPLSCFSFSSLRLEETLEEPLHQFLVCSFRCVCVLGWLRGLPGNVRGSWQSDVRFATQCWLARKTCCRWSTGPMWSTALHFLHFLADGSGRQRSGEVLPCPNRLGFLSAARTVRFEALPRPGHLPSTVSALVVHSDLLKALQLLSAILPFAQQGQGAAAAFHDATLDRSTSEPQDQPGSLYVWCRRQVPRGYTVSVETKSKRCHQESSHIPATTRRRCPIHPSGTK